MKILKYKKYKYNGNSVYVEYSNISSVIILDECVCIVFRSGFDGIFNHNLTREDFTKKFENWLIDNQTIFDVDLVLNN